MPDISSSQNNKKQRVGDSYKLHEATKKLLAGREYIGVDRIDCPLVFIKNTHPVGYRELVECIDDTG